MLNNIEAFADAMMMYEGWKPGSRSNRNRNPLNLRRPKPTVDTDEQGFRVFDSLVNGYIAGIGDVRQKFSGHNDHGLGPESTVLEYFHVHAPSQDGNEPEKYAAFVAEWVSKAIGKPLTMHSRLGEIAMLV